jgi:cobalt-precorrin 5A hydrolase
MTKRQAVVAITKNGVVIARHIKQFLQDCDVYYPEKFAQGDEQQLGIEFIQGSVSTHVSKIFHSYRAIIGVISLGAMVRLIAPHLLDKKTDPAIVVIDDKAEHVISVLSGHLGGANQLAREVADFLSAKPIITTASDVGQTIAVDLLGREFGFEIENFELVKKVSAAVVNEQTIHIVQEAGERHWWPYEKLLPRNLHMFHSMKEAILEPCDAALIITHRLLPEHEYRSLLDCSVIYRPKVIVVGIGCNRGTPADEIEQAIEDILAKAQLSLKSVRNLATIDIKKDEEGILEVCRRYGWNLETFTAEELNTIQISNPSEMVYKYVGAYGVSEPAARLSSGSRSSLVEKVKVGNVTISVCLVNDNLEMRNA